ncbi:hypothetical protein [Dyadobacter sp. NIV53]|uniref:hypothetical protein n=1 Tax=Dyadobacter sp. NIV53 TaxID=2861765 RepID=UPI001C87C8BF|nr:hypothetical protein [Dyadobacter sp. NIV53]
MKMNELFDEAPFVNEECGDTMWNDENLNPPKSDSGKSLPEEGIKSEAEQDSSASGSR